MAELTPASSEETPGTPPENAPESPVEASEPSAETAPARQRPPLLAVVLAVVALGLAVYIGTNVLSVLYAVIAPPAPPTPPNMSQISHISEAYGVDQWKYVSTDDACTLLQYIQEKGGDCVIAPLACGTQREVDPYLSTDNTIVARCSGQMAFSIFNEQWWNLITRTHDGKAQIEINREVYWIGTGPEDQPQTTPAQ
ncbi:MAG TPA: hypothetical protein VHD90_24540 [Phototrophicaceae bacterium]|nr:hypothetical protein [Phototrophicaceae bacterium]